jgi:Fe-S-cluster containining protein
MTSKIRERYREFDVAIESLVAHTRRIGWDVPCKSGCDACCYDVVLMSHHEALPLLERIGTWPIARQDALKRRIAEWYRTMKGLGVNPLRVPDGPGESLDAFHRTRVPCPLLDRERHECMVYEERPIACRGHVVGNTSPATCARQGEAGVSVNILRTREMQCDVTVAIARDHDGTLELGFLPVILAVTLNSRDKA